MLITGTNYYAQYKIAELSRTGKLTHGSRWNRWRPVTAEEMRAVIAIIINMRVMSISDLEAYWKTSWEFYIPFFHDVMGRNRFQEIFLNLHIPHPAQSTGRVYKVCLLLDHICRKSRLAFHLEKEVAVDETMVGFRGRVSFKQYCPKKPTKYDLKFFVLADSTTGYVYNFLLYTGREITLTLPCTFSRLSIPGQFVMALMQDLLDRGHIVYTDRFYTSIPLADTLSSRGTGLVGTLVPDWKGLPWEVRVRNFKMRINEVKAWRHENSLVVAWQHEKKSQFVCSQPHSLQPLQELW